MGAGEPAPASWRVHVRFVRTCSGGGSPFPEVLESSADEGPSHAGVLEPIPDHLLAAGLAPPGPRRAADPEPSGSCGAVTGHKTGLPAPPSHPGDFATGNRPSLGHTTRTARWPRENDRNRFTMRRTSRRSRPTPGSVRITAAARLPARHASLYRHIPPHLHPFPPHLHPFVDLAATPYPKTLPLQRPQPSASSPPLSFSSSARTDSA